MTKDTEALREALDVHFPTGIWRQPCGNHVLCCGCDEDLWGVDRDACRAAWRLHVIEALTTPASDVAPDEYDTLIAAGFNDYAAHCALRTEPDGGFCHAYFYSDGQWRFQTGGNDLTLADGTILRCVLTKRLYAHPPLAQSVEHVAGEALREAAVDFMAIFDPAAYVEKDLSDSRYADVARKFLAALQGPAA